MLHSITQASAPTLGAHTRNESRKTMLVSAQSPLNPLDQQLATSIGGMDVWDAVSQSFGTLNGIPADLEAALKQMDATIAQVMASGRLTEGAKAQDEADARQKAANMVVALRQTADASRAQVLSVVDGILDGNAAGSIDGNNPAAQALFMERRRDAWVGAKMILDGVQDTGHLVTRFTTMAKDAAQARNYPLMSALRQWASPYLESRGVTYAPSVLERVLDEATAPAMSPRVRAAMVIKAEFLRGWASLESDFDQAQKSAMRKNWMRVSGLPGWLPNSTVRM